MSFPLVPLCSPQVLFPSLASFQERLKTEKHFSKACKCLQHVGVPNSTELQTTEPPACVYSALNWGDRGAPAKTQQVRRSLCSSWLHPFPRRPYTASQVVLKHHGVSRLPLEYGHSTSHLFPRDNDSTPSVTPFSQRAKGLNSNCSTTGYFSGLRVPVRCESAERGQECKCVDAVPRRPCAPALQNPIWVSLCRGHGPFLCN